MVASDSRVDEGEDPVKKSLTEVNSTIFILKKKPDFFVFNLNHLLMVKVRWVFC